MCESICEGKIVCGRNAECSAAKHEPVCSCKEGYHGNPLIGCSKIECSSDNDCSADKLCEGNMCKISCLVKNPCGTNALCSAENHKQVCYCQPGYTGNPILGCKALDFCSSNPCGNSATCVNSRGSYKCMCPIGTVGDPYAEGCKTPAECERNEDCPSAAHCTLINDVPKCKG
jgi:hypothetical protein